MVDGRRPLPTAVYRLSSIVFFLAGLGTRLAAQADPTGHWRTFESAHFNVHVREEYRDLGPRAAGEAEAAWSALAALIPAPRSRIELVVADNIDETNGYASTYPVPNIVIYALPPAGDVELEAYDRWLRLVITHELAHVFHLDLARGWWRVGRSVLGRAPFLFPNDYTPPWMREGLAVFYESRLTSAGRLGGAFFNAVVRAAGDEAGGLRLDAANTPTPKWPSGTRAYAFGAAFFQRAADDFGDSAVSRFALALASKPIPYLQLGSAWRRATGSALSASWWQAQTRMEPLADAPTLPRSHAPTLLSRLRLTEPPRISPGGRFIALAHNDGRDATRLLVLDRLARVDDTMPPAWKDVARLDASSGLAWMPDGTVLASRLEFTDLYTLRADLWVFDRGGRMRQLTRGQRLFEPDVASDGAIVAVRAVPGGRELVLIQAGRRSGGQAVDNIDPASIRVIVPPEPGVEYASPRFDSSGQRIALVRVEGGWHDIRIVDRTGHTVRDMTHDSVPDLMPAFSPDGSWLTWSREVEGVPQIVGINLRGDGSLVQLTDEPYAAYAPAPAGDSLFYLAYHADGYRLQVVPLIGGPPLVLPSLAPHAVGDAPAADVRREHAYRAFPSVLPQYWIPQLFVESGGSWIGALSSGTDAIGRHTWAASLLAGLGTLHGQVAGDALYLYRGLRHVAIDGSLSHHPRVFVGGIAGPGGTTTPVVQCCDPDAAADAGVTFFRRRWRTQATVRVGIEATSGQQATRRGASIAGSLAHVVAPPLAISPQDGWRLSASVRHRERTTGPLQSTEMVVRGAAYLSGASGSFAKQVFAVRASFGTVAGTDPVVFGVGGVSSGAVSVLPGVVLGGGTRTFPVRGFAPGTLAGRSALGISLENRVPLALVDRGLGMLPLGLDRLSAALFTDAGVAWSAAYCPVFSPGGGPRPLCGSGIWSVGAELAADLGLSYTFPLRVRLGGALQVTNHGKAGAWIAVGPAF